MTSFHADVQAMLPLPSVTFHVLIAVSSGPCHGYAIIQDVASRTTGTLRLGAGTLYRSMARMVEQGLIAETSKRPAQGDDERRRYYRITPFGTAVARAEMRRLSNLVQLARASGLTPESA
jgi:DNA-binding PadR family transcriptional regulator